MTSADMMLILLRYQEEEEIYWSSRESTSNFSESFYDSYDPFSYMADRVNRFFFFTVFLSLALVMLCNIFNMRNQLPKE